MALPKKILMILVRSAVLVHMAIILAVPFASLAVVVLSVWKVRHFFCILSHCVRFFAILGPVVERPDNVIHRVNHYSVEGNHARMSARE